MAVLKKRMAQDMIADGGGNRKLYQMLTSMVQLINDLLIPGIETWKNMNFRLFVIEYSRYSCLLFHHKEFCFFYFKSWVVYCLVLTKMQSWGRPVICSFIHSKDISQYLLWDWCCAGSRVQSGRGKKGFIAVLQGKTDNGT